jgi:signal transduction histidine kinase
MSQAKSHAVRTVQRIELEMANVIGSAMAIVGLTGTVLYRFARHATVLKRELSIADGRRLTELSTLMVGMAHEIRNPLNSIRLNLYTSERVFCGDTKLADQEVLSMLSESVREIERVDSIIGQLLGYARTENDCGEEVDVANEILAAIKFVSPTFENQAITIEFDNKAPLVTITMDRRRLRQILLNLLNNARDALADGGRIKVTLETHGKLARLTVADSGVGVDASIRSRMFEPFVSTRDTGTGLGLAIVKSMLESIEGVIDYETSEELGGAEFILSFPTNRSLR